MDYANLSITNLPSISAIYFALLQCKYDYYSIERDSLVLDKLRSFITRDSSEYIFFSDVKQNMCDVYPYWPRAAMLETATFYINSTLGQFDDFNEYKRIIMSAKNLSETERNHSFWDWVEKFPEALNLVLKNDSFNQYLKWENDWIVEQNEKHKEELSCIGELLALLHHNFKSPVENFRIILNPIKCVYSADYHLVDKNFIFCSGSLDKKSVIHEFIHHILHPTVEKHQNEILCCDFTNFNIDISYYLANDESGRLNAFEEYLVRKLTDLTIEGNIPKSLEVFLEQNINI